MKSSIMALAACALALALSGCGDNSRFRAICGDAVCDASETAAACAEDCGCGNGVVNPGEACDGADLAGASCESEVQGTGTLACNADCSFDLTGCDASACGNGVAEPGEACDGADLAGATCSTVGFSAGELGCDAGCNHEVASCCNDFCAADNTSVCVGDTVETCTLQSNGCLGVEVTDCAAADDVCDDRGGAAACICVDRCSAAGAGHCLGTIAETCTLQPDGCLAWVASTDCSTTAQVCAVGPQGPTCVADATGEDCSDPYPLTAGENVIAWTAISADYLTIQPSCNTSSLTGPDVVLAFTASVDGIVTFSMTKPAAARQVVVVSSGTCGTLTTELACVADLAETSQGDTFAVAAGTTYHFYVRDTTSGTALLDNPLALAVDEVACASFTNATSNLAPANASTIATTSPVLSVDLDHPVNPGLGVITITGDLGTNLSFDLATSPAEVTFTSGGRTIVIDPATGFLPGEEITVSWSGLVDAFCAAPVAPPVWTFEVLTPSCAPGVGGMVGTTVTRLATGLTSLTENYVAADTAAGGYVYVGGSTDLYRLPKAGGVLEDVVVSAGITSTQLGSSMAIVGSRIFTLDTTTTAVTPFLWRLSTSGGVTWNPQGYGQFPTAATDIPRAMFHHQGRLYMVTDEVTAGIPTQIWSVSATAVSLPDEAVLEGTVAGEEDCDGISGDDDFFYLTCGNLDRLVRVDRTTFVSELITDTINLSLTKNEVHAHDFDADGQADALYVVSDEERVHYVCGPAGTGPFWRDVLVEYGPGAAGAGNYGLGFDPVGNVLWAFDDDSFELVSIQ
jgi:hypothetical protein